MQDLGEAIDTAIQDQMFRILISRALRNATGWFLFFSFFLNGKQKIKKISMLCFQAFSLNTTLHMRQVFTASNQKHKLHTITNIGPF